MNSELRKEIGDRIVEHMMTTGSFDQIREDFDRDFTSSQQYVKLKEDLKPDVEDFLRNTVNLGDHRNRLREQLKRYFDNNSTFGWSLSSAIHNALREKRDEHKRIHAEQTWIYLEKYLTVEQSKPDSQSQLEKESHPQESECTDGSDSQIVTGKSLSEEPDSKLDIKLVPEVIPETKFVAETSSKAIPEPEVVSESKVESMVVTTEIKPEPVITIGTKLEPADSIENNPDHLPCQFPIECDSKMQTPIHQIPLPDIPLPPPPQSRPIVESEYDSEAIEMELASPEESPQRPLFSPVSPCKLPSSPALSEVSSVNTGDLSDFDDTLSLHPEETIYFENRGAIKLEEAKKIFHKSTESDTAVESDATVESGTENSSRRSSRREHKPSTRYSSKEFVN